MNIEVMTAKMLLVLLVLLVSSTGVHPQRPQVLYVKAGEMVVLQCPHYRWYNDGDAKLLWTSHTTQEMNLTNSMSTSAEQRQMGVLVHDRSLLILRASVNHQGNYSCSLGNGGGQSWFRLTVYTTQSRENEKRTQYPATCYTQESCTLNCPEVNIPPVNTPNITSNGIIWHKEGKLSPQDSYFSSVDVKDSGVYTCTRSYLYHGQIYIMNFTVVLNVQPIKMSGLSVILSPLNNDVFQVDLNSTVVIDCKAVIYSEFDEVFWLSGESFVETNNSFPVFYNYTRENDTEETRVTASLVLKKTSEEDLLKHYTCKLESDSQPSSSVTISLTQKARPVALPLALCLVSLMVVIILTIVFVKLKINIALFLRDTFGCYRSTSDAKSYDVYLMYYKSDTYAGLSEDDRKWLESVLEERFGYRLCHDVLTETAVLDCIERSRTVVLVPTSSDPGLESNLLQDIHAAFVEQQSRLVFIKTETVETWSTGSLPEALQRLGEAGVCVTWKDRSSSFCKQLRSYLSAPQHAPRPQTAALDHNRSNI